MSVSSGSVPSRSVGARRGAALHEVALVVAALGAVGAAGVAIAPGVIRASVSEPGLAEVMPADAERRLIAEGLRRLIGGSHAVLGSWRDESSGRADVALWAFDGRDPGSINVGELLVLSFSPTVGVLTAHVYGSEKGSGGDGLYTGSLGGDFARRWRGRAGVERSVVCADLRTVRFDRGDPPDGGGSMRVRLVWSGVASDEAGAEALFSVGVPWAGVSGGGDAKE